MHRIKGNSFDVYADNNDYGKEPYVFNIELSTEQNENFRVAKWTGENMQLTLMSIQPGDDIGLEIHNDVEQFIRIVEGTGRVMMGKEKNKLNYQKDVNKDYAVIIPKGTWHNLINTGRCPLKLYSVYSPANHNAGTVHRTKQDAENDEHHK